jgi:hypothetical protein
MDARRHTAYLRLRSTPKTAGNEMILERRRLSGGARTLGRRAPRRRLSEVVMKSFISLLVALAVACVLAVPASAMPTDNGPQPVAHVRHAAPMAPASDDGTPAFVYVLIGCGAAAALGAGGFMGARSVTRRLTPRAS